MPSRQPGQVITFYSYKGGTGRTMALANVAYLLAQQGAGHSKVLMIDWDLDAPGLHRYFHDRLARHFASHPSPEKALEEHQGLIDLFLDLDGMAPRSIADDPDRSQEEAEQLLADFEIGPFVLPTDIEGLWMLKAGSFTPDYGERVNTFRWEDLYRRCPALFTVFAEWLANRYDYVLIDSRTGLSDISGICTMLMPEKLVAVFTPNRQSLEGVLEASRRAVHYRSRSDDLRPLVVFPLASRIEPARLSLRDAWRFGSSEMRIEGYQPALQELFRDIYGLHDCNLSDYFDEIQVQQSPDFAYGEEIAALVERGADRLSLTGVYQSFTEILIRQRSPWENAVEDASKRATAEKSRLAERAYTALALEDQEVAQRLFTRLVRLASPEEGGEDVPHRVWLNEFDDEAKRLVEILKEAQILVLGVDETTKRPYVELADSDLLEHWPRLRAWLKADREFLLWRQRLQTKSLEWKRARRSRDLLLRGSALAEAERWLKNRPQEFGSDEKLFILTSRKRTLTSRSLLAVASLLLLVLGYMLVVQWRRTLYTDLLESWGLPRELYTWSEQLGNLKLPRAVNRVDWLHKARSLRRLDLSGTNVKDLEGLPPSLTFVDLSFTEISSLDGLPSTLESLTLRSTRVRTLQNLPQHLQILDFRGAPVDNLTGLPPGLIELSLEAERLQTLQGLPDSLRILRLSRYPMPTLASLPEGIESLSLTETRLRSLEGLPASLRVLTLVNNGALRLDTFPPSLRQLKIDFSPAPVDLSRISRPLQTLSLARVGIGALPDDPSSLQVVELAETSIRDLRWLPDSLRSLSIAQSGQETPIAALPPFLRSLSLPWSMEPDLRDVPRSVESLDLSFSRLSTLVGLPQSLKQLTLNNAYLPALDVLPPRLEELNFQAFRNRVLPALPPGLKKLDLSGSRSLSKLDRLPASLEELNISGTTISSLNLPAGLRWLDASNSRIRNLQGLLPPGLIFLRVNSRQLRGLEALPRSLRELEIVDESESTQPEGQTGVP